NCGIYSELDLVSLLFHRHGGPRYLHSFPTRRSSDLLDFDDEKKRIALGLKQITEHPWESLDTSLEVGSKVKGKIVTVADYGAFLDRKSTRLNSSHVKISYAVFCLKKKINCEATVVKE